MFVQYFLYIVLIILVMFLFSVLLKVNKKYVAPLLLAYDDRIKEKHGIIKAYEVSWEVNLNALSSFVIGYSLLMMAEKQQCLSNCLLGHLHGHWCPMDVGGVLAV